MLLHTGSREVGLSVCRHSLTGKIYYMIVVIGVSSGGGGNNICVCGWFFVLDLRLSIKCMQVYVLSIPALHESSYIYSD